MYNRFIIAIIILGTSCGAQDSRAASEIDPKNTGPLKLLSASWLGGEFGGEIVSVKIAANGSVLLAGNSVNLKLDGLKEIVIGNDDAIQNAKPPADPKKSKNWKHPSTSGFILRLAQDGQSVISMTRFGHGLATIHKIALDKKENIYVLCESGASLTLGNSTGQGRFIAVLTPDASQVTGALFHANATDFGVDSNGELVVLSNAELTRYSADGKEKKWTATWKSHGSNRPGGIAVSPDTGITTVIGYGMTKTGHEPYKDPYAYGFDSSGKEIWAIWNPDPTKEAASQFGGNGLMADTSGIFAADASNGKAFVSFRADGGNTVLSRNPRDPFAPLDAAVFEGVFQKTAGYGFKGASMTSAIFRLDTQKGELEKGTFMCAWLTPARANGLKMSYAAGDEQGRQFVVGGSASGCPVKEPWYTVGEGEYKGGGFLAAFDKDFKMLQCGYFPGTEVDTVASRNGVVVIGGSAHDKVRDPDPGKPGDAPPQVPIFKPVQKIYGGGDRNGWFAIFKM